MDIMDATILDLHIMLGHDKAASVLGVPPYDKAECALCHPELVGAVTQSDAMRVVSARG